VVRNFYLLFVPFHPALAAAAVQLRHINVFTAQSMLLGPLELDPGADAAAGAAGGPPAAGTPIAALLDGVSVQAHSLLSNRLVLDDPHNLQERTMVSRRVYGTAMDSLGP
jgi:hypothetical protein